MAVALCLALPIATCADILRHVYQSLTQPRVHYPAYVRSALLTLPYGRVWRARRGQEIVLAKVMECPPRAFVSLVCIPVLLLAHVLRLRSSKQLADYYHQARCRIKSSLPLKESHQRHPGCSVASRILVTFVPDCERQSNHTLAAETPFCDTRARDRSQDRREQQIRPKRRTSFGARVSPCLAFNRKQRLQ
jgi:hypothetical protein